MNSTTEYLDTLKTMDDIMGRTMVSWGFNDNMYHIHLDDGRALIFVGLGVVLKYKEHGLN